MPSIPTESTPSTVVGTATNAGTGTATGSLDRALVGLDALELAEDRPGGERLRRLWSAAWPKMAATAIALLLWQLVVWSGWKPEYILPGPAATFGALWEGLTDGVLLKATAITLQRAVVGFTLALVIGVCIGAAVSRIQVLRTAVGSMITGLQTMPSIAWFPLAILLFKLSEAAILFVVVIGAAPAIANGLIAGSDNLPPLLVRAGRMLGARRFTLYRSVVLPGSMPSFVAGMKQGWAFAWRSLMAGELIVIIGTKPSIGFQLQNARQLADAPELMATMVLILIIGILVDSLVFGNLERAIRRRWGLLEPTR